MIVKLKDGVNDMLSNKMFIKKENEDGSLTLTGTVSIDVGKDDVETVEDVFINSIYDFVSNLSFINIEKDKLYSSLFETKISLKHLYNLDRKGDNIYPNKITNKMASNAYSIYVKEILESRANFDTLSNIMSKFKLRIVEMLKKKNNDYGDSNLVEYGNIGVIVRLNDKLARLENLYNNKTSGMVTETYEDTLMDIVGYCANWNRLWKENKMK